MRKIIIVCTMFVLGLFLMSGCYESTRGSGTSTAPPTQAVPAPGFEDVEEMVVSSEGQTTEEEVSTREVVEIDMIAKQWEFVPGTIEVNVGDKVELHVTSTDVAHGFMLPDFGINERLPVGEDVHITFIADKKGTFLFACSVPCGRGHSGMKGQLIVK